MVDLQCFRAQEGDSVILIHIDCFEIISSNYRLFRILDSVKLEGTGVYMSRGNGDRAACSWPPSSHQAFVGCRGQRIAGSAAP